MFEGTAPAITAFVRHNNSPLGLVVLAACALIEYLFPPFPGDVITISASYLVIEYGWSMPRIFGALLAGAAIGSMGDYYVGTLMRHRYDSGGIIRNKKARHRIDRVLQSFRRHGSAYVALNRFLPGIRGVIFLAAGMAELDPLKVLIYSVLSASAWNGLLLSLGYGVGSEWEQIQSLLKGYAHVFWTVAIVGVLLVVVWRRRR